MTGRALTIDITTRDQQTLAALKRIQRELGQLDKSIDTTARQGDKLGASADEYAQKLSGARDAAGSIVLGGTALVLGKATKDASDLNEAMQANAATFRDNAAAVEEFAESASAIGISKKDALDATATFGSLFVQLGVGTDEASKLSTELTTLAADFGSFKNVDVTQVLEAQAAAFRGEYDALQRFVPTINAAAVEQQALAETGKASAKELTQQEKALATYALMLEGAGPALGDFARNADGAANSAKVAGAEVTNASASLGEELVPIYAQAAKAAGGLASAFQLLPGPAQTAVVGVGGLTLGVGLLAPRLIEGAKVMQLAGSKAADLATRLVLPKSAVTGLGSATDSTTPKIGKFGVALGALGAAAAAYELIQLGRAMGETKISAEDALRSTTAELEELVAGMEGIASQSDFEAMGRQNVDALFSMRDAAVAAGIPHPKLAAAIREVEQENARAAERTAEYADSAEGAAGASTDLAAGQTDAASAAERQAQAAQEAASAVDGLRSAEEGVASAREGVASAQAGLADAEHGVAEAREGVADASRGVADAEQGLADARAGAQEAAAELADAERDLRDGTDDLRDAEDGVVDAEKDLAAAHRDTQLAQEDLTAARERAAEVLEDMAVSAKSAVLDEREAVLDLADARAALAAGPKIDSGDGDETAEQAADRERRNAEARREWAEDRERLQIRVERAELRLAEAQERNQDAATELADAQEKGIEQSDAVTAAKDAIAEAAEREKGAEEGLVDAKARVVEVQEELAQRVVEAQGRVVEANDRVRDAADRVRDAVDQVAEAQQRVVDQQGAVVEARLAVEGAERKVVEAQYAELAAQGEVEAAVRDGSAAIQEQLAKYDAMIAKLAPGSPLRLYVEGLRTKLLELAGTYDVDVNLNTSFWSKVGQVPGFERGGRAAGGRVGPGRAYPVGEDGPEVLELDPGESGRVWTAEQWQVEQRRRAAYAERDRRAASKGQERVRDVNLSVTVNEASNPWLAADLVGREVTRALQVGPAH